jgi:phospholipid/cholesterol/gamma-HCH transport system substrate-binding protein
MNLSSIIVAIKLKDDYHIPKNSVATIKDNPLGSPSIAVLLGNAPQYLKPGDTLLTAASAGLLGDVMSKLGPVGDQVTVTLHSLDSVLKNINTIFDPATKNNMQQVIANMNRTTASLVASSASIQSMLNQQSGAIAQSMTNISSFTRNLSDNNEKVNRMLSNAEKATDNFSKTDIAGTVDKLKASVTNLNNMIAKMSSSDGTLGKLVNDRTLYNNLTNTVRSANILMDDIRVNPKRYVNISVFGKKDKGTALTAPLNDSTQKKP